MVVQGRDFVGFFLLGIAIILHMDSFFAKIFQSTSSHCSNKKWLWSVVEPQCIWASESPFSAAAAAATDVDTVAGPLLIETWMMCKKQARDPNNTGVVAILHPWESGMDNSPAWDESMTFPIDPTLPPYERQDLTHVNANMRPTKETYDRYLTLLYRYEL